MFDPPPTPKRWHEPIRLALTVVWVSTLALWTYFPMIGLQSGDKWGSTALEVSSAMLRTAVPLWFASFFPALAFGLAWYTFAHQLRRSPSRSPIDCGIDRLATAQSYMTLALGACLFLLNWRILPFQPMTSNGWGRIAEPVVDFTWGGGDSWRGPPALEQLAIIGALGAAVIFARAWGLIPQLGGRRRNLTVVTLALVITGLALPWTGALHRLPSPVPKVLREIDRDDPVVRGLLFGDSSQRRTSELTLKQFFETHDDGGRVVPLRSVQKNRLGHWPNLVKGLSWDEMRDRAEELDAESARLACELCQLPGTYAWTLHGFSLAIGGGERPRLGAPSYVVEIPRRTFESRVYDPGKDSSFEVVPTARIASAVEGADRVALKIDWAVGMGTVLDVLKALRDGGASQVDLAVIPSDFVALPESHPRLLLGASESGVPYAGQPHLIKKYVPPRPAFHWTESDLLLPRPMCREVELSEDYCEAWRKWQVEAYGSLESRVSIGVEPNMFYGEFIGVLQGAIVGGAREINLVLAEATGQTEP